MSGNAAAANIEGFVYVAMNAFSQTSMNYTGQNAGAKRYDRVRRILILCSLCVSVTGIILGGGIYLAARPLLGIYITDSPEAIAYGVTRMMFVGLPYFLCGLMEVVTGSLRGLGASTTPMVISVLGVCGMRLGWIFTIFRDPRFHSLESLFASYPISWIFTFAVDIIAFIFIYRRHVRQSQQNLLHHR